MSRVFGVLGFPLAQSLSPFLHSRALAAAGLDDTYTAWEIPPKNLAAFMRAFRETPFHGASVTIPHKEAVIPFVDEMTEEAGTIGAVNTLYWEHGKLFGHNTDMEGFVAPLRGGAPFSRALVLGAGGAARAILAGLAALGIGEVFLAARDRARAERLAAEFASRFGAITVKDWECRATPLAATQEPALVINATPLGMRGKAEGVSPLPEGAFAAARNPARNLAYDIVYNPLETAFLAQARAAGWRTEDGLAMFAGQAAAQFRLWTGLAMDVAATRALLARHLATVFGGS